MLSDQLEQIVGAVRDRLDGCRVVDVANDCHLSQSGIYRILAGGHPSLATLKTLCHYFDNHGPDDIR
ncbi:MAG: hypothetical protein WDZ51_03465 [Pirellulaceae bacterium]